MIAILSSVAADGTVSATDFSDLKTIVADAATLDMPGYVKVLATDVVDGNLANAASRASRWATWPPAARLAS